MSQLTRLTLLLSMAASLAFAQLSIGTVAASPGQTVSLSVALNTGGAAVAALQFDLTYDRAALTVTVDAGSAAVAAQKSISVNDLGTGQRAIVLGGRTVIADGEVAKLTITIAANATLGNRALTLSNLLATDPDATVVLLRATDGAVNVSLPYKVGDVAPFTADTAPQFGDGNLSLLDLIQVLFAVNNVPGFRPADCTDRFDAMDVYPVDDGLTRGGDGVLDIRDLIRELFRVNNLDPDRPTRTSLGGCKGLVSQTARYATRISRTQADGSLVLGAPQKSTAGEERIPVYLEARHDLVRVAVTFAAGDQRSQLRFEAVSGAQPTLAPESQLGAVAVAWLDGVSVRAGGRLLLGYVVGPAGMSENVKVFGMSAGGIEDYRDVRLETLTRIVRDR